MCATRYCRSPPLAKSASCLKGEWDDYESVHTLELVTLSLSMPAWLQVHTRHSLPRAIWPCGGQVSNKRVPGTVTIRSRHDLHTDRATAPPAATPLRKQLKEEAKARKLAAASNGTQVKGGPRDAWSRKWELIIGIEIHAELNTERKLFSTAKTSLADAPNTHVAPFDAALPGAQPQFQKETLLPAMRAALALGCEIQRRSSWDRKHYFWWDQPNGYQITQYYGKRFADSSQTSLELMSLVQSHLPGMGSSFSMSTTTSTRRTARASR